MNEMRITVLGLELKAVRALRSASDKDLVREALNREDELEAQIATLSGASVTLAASFASRDEDPAPEKTKGER